MTSRDALAIARRWWLVVVAAVALGGAGAFVLTSQMSPVYRAEATLLVNQAQNPAAATYQDILGSQQLTATYAELATSNLNLERAVGTLAGTDVDVSSLEDRVSARAIDDTQLVRVAAEDADPDRAALFANTVAEVFIGYIEEAQLAGASATGERPINTVFVAARATAPDSPIAPSMMLNVAIGLVLALVLVGGVIAVIEYFNDHVESRDDVDRLALPYLGGVIQSPRPRRANDWVARPGDDGSLLESFRQVQANLNFALSTSPARVILITSPSQGDGKSTVATNLAAALAESSKRVLLIDGDLRKPDAHRYFSLPNTSGLSTAVIAGPESAVSFTRSVSDMLSVLTAGPVPPNATAMISAPRMASTIEALSPEFEVIVIDSPPLLGIADASIWATLVDAVVLVSRRKKTRRGQLEEAASIIHASGKPLLGVVVNGQAQPKRDSYYYYGYGATPPRQGSDTAPRPGSARMGRKKPSIITDE